MSDVLEVLVVGNLRDDPRVVERATETIATATICVRRSELAPSGTLDDTRICLPIEVVGATPAHTFVRLHKKGSRVALRGVLAERETPSEGKARQAAAMVIIVERLLHLDPPPPSPVQTPAVTDRGALRAPWDT